MSAAAVWASSLANGRMPRRSSSSPMKNRIALAMMSEPASSGSWGIAPLIPATMRAAARMAIGAEAKTAMPPIRGIPESLQWRLRSGFRSLTFTRVRRPATTRLVMTETTNTTNRSTGRVITDVECPRESQNGSHGTIGNHARSGVTVAGLLMFTMAQQDARGGPYAHWGKAYVGGLKGAQRGRQRYASGPTIPSFWDVWPLVRATSHLPLELA